MKTFIFFLLFALISLEKVTGYHLSVEINLELQTIEAVGDNEGFADECSTDGLVLVIGAADANDGDGMAYVYEQDNDTSEWSLVAELTASDSGDNDDRPDDFGGAVAVSGDFIVIGAEGADQAYIFQRNDDGEWEEIFILFAQGSVDPIGESFGDEVHIDGDIIAVGAEDWGDTGAVFVFDRTIPFDLDNDHWGKVAVLSAETPQFGGHFGSSVYVDGDYIFVGADGENDEEGGAYVFGKDVGGTNNWGLVAVLSPSDLPSEARFGNSIASENGVLAVGAPNNGDSTGLVYLFYQDLDGVDSWGELLSVKAEDEEVGNDFGGAVALTVDGETLFVSAETDDTSEAEDAGGVYVFDRGQRGSGDDGEDDDDDDNDFIEDDNDLDNWGQIAIIRADEDSLEGLEFGDCVTVSDELNLVVGSSAFDDGTGRAYTYTVTFSSASSINSFFITLLKNLF